MENTSNAAMPDNKTIGINDNFEIKYWSDEFGISKDELVKAIQAGETPTAAVEKYVKNLVLVN